MVITAIADTSIFIAHESGRPLAVTRLPDHLSVSVITIGELRAGVLAATDPATSQLRLRTLEFAQRLDPIPVDEDVAAAWALLRLRLRDMKRRMPLNDSWIAATAIAHDLAVATRDNDYDDTPGLTVVRV